MLDAHFDFKMTYPEANPVDACAPIDDANLAITSPVKLPVLANGHPAPRRWARIDAL